MCILMSVRMLVLCVMSLFCCQYLVFIQILHKNRLSSMVIMVQIERFWAEIYEFHYFIIPTLLISYILIGCLEDFTLR